MTASRMNVRAKSARYGICPRMSEQTDPQHRCERTASRAMGSVWDGNCSVPPPGVGRQAPVTRS